MVRSTDRLAMTIAVDLGRKAIVVKEEILIKKCWLTCLNLT